MNLNQVTVPVSDIAKSISFYEKLGLQLIVKSESRYARFLCPDGEATFSLHLVDEIVQGEGAYVYFECENLDLKVKQLMTLGIVFDEMPEDKSWLWREARLKDPDGNQLILFYGGKNRINPPWRIN